jgi:hypothetical protein
MKIAELLQTELLQDDECNNVLLTRQLNRWVERYLFGKDGEWVVKEYNKKEKKDSVIFVTDSEDLAVEKLIED